MKIIIFHKEILIFIFKFMNWRIISKYFNNNAILYILMQLYLKNYNYYSILIHINQKIIIRFIKRLYFFKKIQINVR